MTITELEAFYLRLDKMRMTAADRELAKARLAQADALAKGMLGAAGLLKRLFSAHGLRPTSAHG